MNRHDAILSIFASFFHSFVADGIPCTHAADNALEQTKKVIIEVSKIN